jgi:hypothetical protein
MQRETRGSLGRRAVLIEHPETRMAIPAPFVSNFHPDVTARDRKRASSLTSLPPSLSLSLFVFGFPFRLSRESGNIKPTAIGAVFELRHSRCLVLGNLERNRRRATPAWFTRDLSFVSRASSGIIIPGFQPAHYRMCNRQSRPRDNHRR